MKFDNVVKSSITPSIYCVLTVDTIDKACQLLLTGHCREEFVLTEMYNIAR